MSEFTQRDLYMMVNLSQGPLWLAGANLEGARLVEIDLENANLEGANLRSADLTGANLKGAKLNKAILDGANLLSANLEEATLIRATLKRANLVGAKLTNAALGDTHYNSKTIWPRNFDPDEAGAFFVDVDEWT